MEPLANKIRPQSLDEIIGQKHLIGQNRVLRNMIESGRLMNMIFYGPPGTGKTTVARIIANLTDRRFISLNGSLDSLKDLRSALDETETLMGYKGIVIYIDEIHMFNKRNQQILLDYMESGRIVLIGSTTENPHFAVFKALVSRAIILEFKTLDLQDIKDGINRSIEIYKDLNNVDEIKVDDRVLNFISSRSGGDLRKAINSLELILISKEKDNLKSIDISLEDAENILQSKIINFDTDGDSHYDLLSAFQKSIRGSDENAALIYLALLLKGGDIQSVIRRLLVITSEDIGLANPQASMIVKALTDSALQIGLPEARIPLAEAVIFLATCPKSNSVITAIDSANSAVEKGTNLEIPDYLKDAHYSGAKSFDRKGSYRYPHNYKNNYVEAIYMPKELEGKVFYKHGENKYEKATLNYWKAIKEEKK